MPESKRPVDAVAGVHFRFAAFVIDVLLEHVPIEIVVEISRETR